MQSNSTTDVTPQNPPPSPLPSSLVLLHQAIETYRSKIKIILLLIAIPFFFKLAMQGVLMILHQYKIIDFSQPSTMFSTNFRSLMRPDFLLPVGIYVFIGTLTYIVETLGIVALLYVIIHRDKVTKLNEIFNKALRILVPFLFLEILIWIVTLGGIVSFVIPGILFFIWFIFSPYILVAENIGGFSAMLKSKEYIKGYVKYFLKRASFAFVVMIIATLPVFFSGFVRVLLFQQQAFDSFSDNGNTQSFYGKISSALSLFEWIYTMLLAFTVHPVFTIYSYLVFDSIRARKQKVFIEMTKKTKRMLVVFVLLGLLVGIALPFFYLNYMSSIYGTLRTTQYSNLQDQKREEGKNTIKESLDLFKTDHGVYPNSLEELVPNYMDFLPSDPITHKEYEYRTINDANEYEICVDFENVHSCETEGSESE